MNRSILRLPTQLAGERELSEGPATRCAVEEGFVGCRVGDGYRA